MLIKIDVWWTRVTKYVLQMKMTTLHRLPHLKYSLITSLFNFSIAQIISTIRHNDENITGQENIEVAVDDWNDGILVTTPMRPFTFNMEALELPSLELSHLEHPVTYDEIEKWSKICCGIRRQSLMDLRDVSNHHDGTSSRMIL